MRSLGYEGALLIHPSQIPVANDIFGVTTDQVAEAKRLIKAMEDGQRAGKGAIMYNGLMIDEAHLETARAVIARAEALMKKTPEPR